MEIISSGEQEVHIDQGELISFFFKGHELIHQKGSPGWKHSDTEMFPIIGPTEGAGYRVQVSRGNAMQDQHGLLRELSYQLLETSDTKAVYQKSYDAGSVVPNSKYPDRSRLQFMMWPYSFTFRKGYQLDKEGLRLHFEVEGEPDMPYMLGYHPAFKLHSEAPIVQAGEKEIHLKDILEAGSRALEVSTCHELIIRDQVNVNIKTKGFENFMLWTEVPNMLCVEPVTFYPYNTPTQLLHEGFHYLGRESVRFEVQIIPSEVH